MSLKCVCVCGLRYLFMTLQHYNLNYLVYLATCHEKKATEKKEKLFVVVSLGRLQTQTDVASSLTHNDMLTCCVW